MGTTDTPDITLDVSEPFFRLTTESIRLHSNETAHHQTLSSLIDHRALDVSGINSHDTSTIKEHLVSIPTLGNIRLNLTISKTSAKSLAEVQDVLVRQLGSDLTVADALSILLFDYVVERKAARVMEEFGLDRIEFAEFPGAGDGCAA